MNQGSVALVTGASSGFGLLASVELARAGFRVIATMRNPARSGGLDAAVREAGVAVDKLRLDVTDPASVHEAIAAAGRIDVVVNNAGFGMGGYFEDVSDAELREQFETNFFGLAAVTRAVLPQMRERRSGRIINVSSIAGRVGQPGVSAYVASKWAVEGMSESLRLEVRDYGIWVVLIEPGTFKTDIFSRNKRLAKQAQEPSSPYYERAKKLEAFVNRMVEKSKADPRDVARVIVRAATVKRPHLRYLVGKDARAQATLKAMLPERWYEGAIAAVVKRATK